MATVGDISAGFESVVRRFEHAWRGAARPAIADYLPATGEQRTLLMELVHVDLEYRIRAGDERCIEQYLQDFPILDDASVLLDLIVSEYQLRAQHQRTPTLTEYYQRFPQLQEQMTALAADQRWEAYAHTVRDVRPGLPILSKPHLPDITLDGELGRGGMGVVYRGRETALGRIVAVKTLLVYPDHESAVRFRREAETIARLDHPNIVSIHRIGEWYARGTPIPYFAMPYYAGGSLADTSCGIGANIREHVQRLAHVASAIQHAHERGVLHRDLKPSNILLDEQGTPHVADFGLAGWFDTNTPHEFTNILVGTPSYMAPEQARDPAKVTTSVDVYGLGGILYFQLTGLPPFTGETPLATLKMVEDVPPVSPRVHHPGLPADLAIICLKCLAKTPAERYASAGELAADLHAWLDGRPIAARPVTSIERTWRLAKRHPIVTLLSASTFLALVFAVVVLLVSNSQIRQKETIANQARADLQLSYLQQQRVLYIEQVAAAGRLYQSNALEHAWYLLDRCPLEERFWEWHYLNRLRQANATVLSGHAESVRAVAFFADGSPLTLDQQGNLRWWNRRGQLLRTWHVPPADTMKLVAHPHATRVLVTTSKGAFLYDTQTDIVRRYPCTGWGLFHPNGRTLYIAEGRTLARYDLQEQRRLEPVAELESPPTAGVFTRNGQRLLLALNNVGVLVWDTIKQDRIGTVSRRPRPIVQLALTADDKTLIECMPSSIRFTDWEAGRRLRLIDDAPGRPVVQQGMDPNTYFQNTHQNAVALVEMNETRRLRQLFRGHTAYITAMAYDAPRQALLTGSADRTVRLYDLSQPHEYEEFGTVDSLPHILRVSPNGRYLAYVPAVPGTAETAVSVLDLQTKRIIFRKPSWGDVLFGPNDTLIIPTREPALTKWDFRTGEQQASYMLPHLITRLQADENRQQLVSSDIKGHIRWHDAHTLQPIGEAINTQSSVYSLELRDPWLAIGTREGVWLQHRTDPARNERQATATIVRKIGLHPQRDQMVLATNNQPFRLMGIGGQSESQLFIGSPGDVNDLAIHPSGRRLATAGSDGRVRVWDCESGRELLEFDVGHPQALGVAWSPDGQHLFTLGRTIRLWRAE